MGIPTTVAADVVADAPGGMIAALQIMSHLPLIMVIWYAWSRRRWTIATASFNAVFASLVCYHACRAGLFCVPLFLPQARLLDHFASLSLLGELVLTGLNFGMASPGGRPVGQAVRLLLPFVVLLATLAYPFQARSALIVLVFLVVVGLDRYLRLGHHLRPPSLEGYDTRYMVTTLLAGAAAVACYVIDDGNLRGDTVLDGLMHSGWHLFAGLALNSAVAALPRGPEDDE